VITRIEADPANERFGLPEEYQLTLTTDERGGTTVTTQAHYSHLIHVAEDLDEDESHGTPRQEAVWNYLDDMEKIVGASAEAIWRVADRGIQFDMDPETELKPEDEENLKDEIDEYMHDMKRSLLTQGITAKFSEQKPLILAVPTSQLWALFLERLEFHSGFSPVQKLANLLPRRMKGTSTPVFKNVAPPMRNLTLFVL
jgi:hypothetical protein